MKFSTRHVLAAIVAASCITIPASASAMPYSPPTTTRSDSAQSGDDGKTIASPARPRSALAQERYYSSYGTPDKAESTFPAADFRGGDSPVDHPGASRAQPAPTTVEVVRPERTIVRDVDEALPIALSATALLLVLAMFGMMLARTRLVPRPGRSH
jgi:hypothetical protein